MRNILFVSYDGLTDQLGQSQILPYLIELCKDDLQFTILTAEKRDKLETNKQIIFDIIKDYNIKWKYIVYTKTPPVLSTLYDFYRLLKLAKKLHIQNKFDLIHCRSGVPQLICLKFKIKFPNVKFINDIRGFWADERVDGGLWNLKNPIFKIIYNYFKKVEIDCLNSADYNICLTNKAKNYLLTINPAWKINVVPCSVDMNLFDPDKISKDVVSNLKDELGILDSDLVISYLGSLGTWYLIKEMFVFFNQFVIINPNAKFLIITNEKRELVFQMANECLVNEQHLIIVNSKRSKVPLYLSLSNLSIFFIKPCFSKISSSPTKHGEIMAMNIPIISNSGVGDVEEIISKTNTGYLVKEFNEREFSYVINLIKTKPIKIDINIRNAAFDNYSLFKNINIYKNTYRVVFNS